MLPTSLSQIFEQIAVAVVALGHGKFHGKLFCRCGYRRAQKLERSGSHYGNRSGEVATALLFMLLVYWVNRKVIQKKIQRDTVSVNETIFFSDEEYRSDRIPHHSQLLPV